MHRKARNVYLALLAMVLLFFSVPALAGEFSAGASKADITPDLTRWDVPSSGYGQRGPEPMKGVHDHVFCKALVAADAENKAAIVTCDVIGISSDLRNKVLEQVQDLGITDRDLMMTATHTHSGPGAMRKNFIAGLVFGRYNEELTQWIADRVAAAIEEADRAREPAVLKAGRTRLEGVTRNRRDPAGSYNYDTRRFSKAYDPENPENLTDPELTVLRVDSKSGKTMAVLFNFATHSTVLGSDNMQISADWPGVAQREVEKAIPGAAALFVNGAIGDQAPAMDKNSEKTDLEYMQYIGGKVASGVLEVMEDTEPVPATPVRAEMVRREIPPGDSLMGYPAPKSLIKYYFPEMPLQAVRLGNVVLMGAPVEMESEMGLIMKDSARGQGVTYPVVAGLANDTMLYCMTADEFAEGGYEVGNTIFGKIEAGLILGEQMLLVNKVMGTH
ncbi:MAG: neutral/alkaline non-lysosomal ceramidase N-terminal domain-containing protein [bacterium]